MYLGMQVYISLASFSCSQAEDGSCGCKDGSLLGSIGGNLCIYQPEPGKKIPTSSPSRYSRAPFQGVSTSPPDTARQGSAGATWGRHAWRLQVGLPTAPEHPSSIHGGAWQKAMHLIVMVGIKPAMAHECALMQLDCDLCCRVLRPEQHMRRRRIPRAAWLPVQGVQPRGRGPGHSRQMRGQCL